VDNASSSRDSEMRVNEVFAVGRIVRGPVRTEDGLVHFMLDAAHGSDPFHYVCEGKTAGNLMEHCTEGDEVSVEGCLRWIDFPSAGKSLVIFARFISYGRKNKVREIPEGSSDN
jgi:hypothetical protein